MVTKMRFVAVTMAALLAMVVAGCSPSPSKSEDVPTQEPAGATITEDELDLIEAVLPEACQIAFEQLYENEFGPGPGSDREWRNFRLDRCFQPKPEALIPTVRSGEPDYKQVSADVTFTYRYEVRQFNDQNWYDLSGEGLAYLVMERQGDSWSATVKNASGGEPVPLNIPVK